MKKRMMALLLAGVMAATMCGCGSKDDGKKVYNIGNGGINEDKCK